MKLCLSQCVKDLEYLILDEGDRFLEMGFLPTLQNILSYLPKQRRTCLYSATLTEKLNFLVKVGLRDPVSIVVKERSSSRNGRDIISSCHDLPKSLSCYFDVVDYDSKFTYLTHFLSHWHKFLLDRNANLAIAKPLKRGKKLRSALLKPMAVAAVTTMKILVFVSNYSSVQYLTKALKMLFECPDTKNGPSVPTKTVKCSKYLNNNHVEILSLHRKMRHGERAKALRKFKEPINIAQFPSNSATSYSKSPILRVMISTDIMARGIDVDGIDWVIHLDPPSDIQRFIHRSGRTARMKKSSLSISRLNLVNNPLTRTTIDSVTADETTDVMSTAADKTISLVEECNVAGNTLILLHPGREEDFVDFLVINQGIIMKPLSEYCDLKGHDDDDKKLYSPFVFQTPITNNNLLENESILQVIREEAKSDRSFMLKGIKAYVSHVRSYAENKFELIFRIRDLQFGKLANGFGLLYLPRMPEIAKSYRTINSKIEALGNVEKDTIISDCGTEDFKCINSQQFKNKSKQTIENALGFKIPFPTLDIESVPFRDEVKESTRKIKDSTSDDFKKHNISARSKTGTKHNPSVCILDKTKNLRRQRAKHKQMMDKEDIKEFAKDSKLLKKLKRQKITHNEFEDEFYSGLM